MENKFDWEFYIDFYPHLKEKINNHKKALNHYLNIGIKNKLIPNKEILIDNFDWLFYVNFYTELKIKVQNRPFSAYNHYLNYGKKERRIPNENALNMHIEEQEMRIINENKNFVNEKSNENTINILIRTSNRPEYFDICIKSILEQKYTNYRIIICYDKDESLVYLNEYKENCKVEIYPIQIDSSEKYKFNLYCNFLMEQVKEGWIMFLDDDDKLSHDNVFNIINSNILDENELLVWNFFRPDKLIFPENTNNILLGQIDTCSFCFHSKFQNAEKWGDKQFGDFAFFSKLVKNNSFKIKFIDNILTATIFKNKLGNFGN